MICLSPRQFRPIKVEMSKYVKIGADVINLDAISHIQFFENQSGISDRIIIEVGTATVIVDSAIGGRKRMDAIREKLLAVLDPEDWDAIDTGNSIKAQAA
jgi:hypothetical protein